MRADAKLRHLRTAFLAHLLREARLEPLLCDATGHPFSWAAALAAYGIVSAYDLVDVDGAYPAVRSGRRVRIPGVGHVRAARI